MKLTPPSEKPVKARIKVVRIDPWRRRCMVLGCDMDPEAIQRLVGKKTMAAGQLGTKGSVQIMLAGDRLPQIALLGTVEPEYQVLNEHGLPGPVLHGYGIVFGILPAHKKGASIPVGVEWVRDRVIWLNAPDQSAAAAQEDKENG